MNIYKNKKVLIIGVGKTGISCIKFFKNKKSIIYVIDENKNLCKDKINIDNNNIFLGHLKLSWILTSDFIVLSPGVDSNKKEILMAKKYKINIISDIEIFIEEKKKSDFILITGSNGKSTVSNLIYKIIKKNKINVSIGGNFGIPVLSMIKKRSKIYILELSSFQLEILNKVKSKISLILNLYNIHTKRYNNFYKYVNSKLKIYNNSKNCIFNNDNIYTYPKKKFNNINYINFGIFYGNYHLIYEEKNIFLSKNNNKILNCNVLKSFGNHYYLNILSVLSVIDLIDNISFYNSIKVIKNYRNLNSRFKIIKKSNNIIYINNSKSTNPYSTIAAINSINKKYNYIHLLIGGCINSKGFDLLSIFIKYKKIILYFFGKDGIKLLKNFSNLSIYNKEIKILLSLINKNVKKNDIILFSPSCSSFDKFLSFEERGNYFEKIVKNIS